jgi:hypothetical protein
MERIHDRNHGRYVSIQLNEGAVLIDAALAGASAARDVRATLETSLGPVAVKLTAQPQVGDLPFRKLESSASLGEPGLT